jgi:hypothetical protein
MKIPGSILKAFFTTEATEDSEEREKKQLFNWTNPMLSTAKHGIS